MKSLRINPDNERIESIVSPKVSVGFVLDKEPNSTVVQLMVHFTVDIIYSINSSYHFKSIEGIRFDNGGLKPTAINLALMSKDAPDRFSVLFDKECKANGVSFPKAELLAEFSKEEILEFLSYEIERVYPL